MRKSHGGNSRAARKRRNRAAVLCQQMRRGDRKAAFSLLQRRRALLGIAKGGWGWRLAKANAARLQKHRQRLQAAADVAEQQRQETQSTMKLSVRARAALRARYGQGGFRADYGEGECRPVAPGVKCPVCGWTWGSREPHVVAVW
jgi:hypothetical protein